MNDKKISSQPINVYVRLRPLNVNEKHVKNIEITNWKEVTITTTTQKKFTFDAVFGMKSTQISIYETIVKPLIPEILSGYNCTVFAYGQTGTGKTFTMTEGISSVRPLGSIENLYANSPNRTNTFQLDERSGLISRFLMELFRTLQCLQQQYAVRCSYIEIYNEDLRDLLNVNDVRLKIFDDQRCKGGIIIQGIEEVTIHNTLDAMRLLQMGHEKRQTATTQMNDRSSRSHTIFTVIVHTREMGKDGEELVKTGKINLVDLAGSENINRSGAVEQRAREAGNINQSLLTLGRVIKALTEKKPHVPFRESKLTRILQDSLGGKTKTSIIATISPCITNLEETLSTLDYAHRARGITNKPETNQRCSQKRLITEYVENIKRLERDLEANRTGKGHFLTLENYEQLVNEHKNQKVEKDQKTVVKKNLEKKLKLLQEEMDIRKREWIEICVSFENTRVELEKTRKLREQTAMEKKQQEYLAKKFQETAEHLHRDAKNLLEMISTSSYNESVLHDKVTKLYETSVVNSDIVKRSFGNIRQICEDIHNNTHDYIKTSEEYNRRMLDTIASIQVTRQENYQDMEMFMSSISSHMDDVGLVDIKLKIVDACKECFNIIIASLEWHHEQLLSLYDLVLVSNRKQTDDLNNVLQGSKSICEKLRLDSVSDHENNLLEQFEIILQEEESECEDSVLLDISDLQDDLSKTVDLRSDALQSEANKIENDILQRLSSFDEIHGSLQSKFFTFRDKHIRFITKSMNSVFEMKNLTIERIRESFNRMSGAIRSDTDKFFAEINDVQKEVERIAYDEMETIRKGVAESSAELLLHNSEFEKVDDMFRQFDVISGQLKRHDQKTKKYLTNLEALAATNNS